jgi:hypothetical protein
MKYKILYNMMKRVMGSLSGGDVDRILLEDVFGQIVFGNPPKIFGGGYRRTENEMYIVYRSETETSSVKLLIFNKQQNIQNTYFVKLDDSTPLVELVTDSIEMKRYLDQALNNSP